ncbi:hypothetical protein LTS18_011686 [Coniosporium uncinatum]|uniref:Uncharacterized protein n=1 Tax=Coniosporium uncinatum TaxID=93489 RepID=A0ACC3DJU9_9PEZI|nr:hypothetical protein LTS18_011686 [Coniosporium uncinatum]
MADDEGATPTEQILESCRRNNPTLLTTVLSTLPSPTAIAHTLNTAKNALGASALHVAARAGSYEVLDVLLDQEGVEIDGTDRMEGDTALHCAVRFCNGLDKDEWEEGGAVVEILLDAGCDPRLRNKAKLRPIDLVDPRNTELRSILQKAEFSIAMAGDVVEEDGDDGPTGSGSDSD